MALSIGFRVSVSLHPAIQATGRLALAPAGLAPASRTCLSLDTRSLGPPAAMGIEKDSRRTRGLKSACLSGTFSANQRKQSSPIALLIVRQVACQRVGPRTVCTFDGLMACR